LNGIANDHSIDQNIPALSDFFSGLNEFCCSKVIGIFLILQYMENYFSGFGVHVYCVEY